MVLPCARPPRLLSVHVLYCTGHRLFPGRLRRADGVPRVPMVEGGSRAIPAIRHQSQSTKAWALSDWSRGCRSQVLSARSKNLENERDTSDSGSSAIAWRCRSTLRVRQRHPVLYKDKVSIENEENKDASDDVSGTAVLSCRTGCRKERRPCICRKLHQCVQHDSWLAKT